MVNFADEVNPITSDFNRQLFKRAGADYNIVHEIPNIETAMFHVSINEGAFIMPEYLKTSAGALVTVPISDDFAYITLNLIWKKKNPNISVPVFVDSFRTYMRNRNSSR